MNDAVINTHEISTMMDFIPLCIISADAPSSNDI